MRADDCELVDVLSDYRIEQYALRGMGKQIAAILRLHVSVELKDMFRRKLRRAELVQCERVGELGFEDDPSIRRLHNGVRLHAWEQRQGACRMVTDGPRVFFAGSDPPRCRQGNTQQPGYSCFIDLAELCRIAAGW